MALDASEGLVVGVLGPWGSGKTSFLNLAREDFESAEAKVLDFNPWIFSGTEQLVETFFTELSAQLRLKAGLSEIAERMADYGEAFGGLGWLPIAGSWIERGRGGAKLLKKVMERRREDSMGRREKVTAALSDLKSPIVVVLDDIDRLTTDEIRDIFKLVRLTASFPNIIYVVAFDRARVEKALEDQGVPGRDYLEKILHVAVDLPTVSEIDLSSFRHPTEPPRSRWWV
jgi:predicted KAP-like P-loop ATPase